MKSARRRKGLTAVVLAMLPVWICAIVFAVAVSECGDGNRSSAGVPIPRQTAYSRIVVPDTIYNELQDTPLEFRINASAVASRDTSHNVADGSWWYNVGYPSLGVTMHCTFSNVEGRKLSEAIANRQERMALNVGDLVAEITELDNPGGFYSTIVKSNGVTATPLQFLSTNNKDWLVYGVLYFNDESSIANPDSVSPIVSAVNRDIIHALKNLKIKR